MGNIGRPSRGCILCRKRRVKCDQRKPGCLRCEKIEKKCPGYKHPEKWVFISQDGGVGTSVSLNSSPVNASGLSLSHGQSLTRESPSSGGQEALAFDRPMPDLCDDFDTRSVHLFLKTWSYNCQPEGNIPAHLDFLPSLYTKCSSHSCLHKAVSLVACRNFMSRYHAPTISRLAAKKYSEALRSVNKVLADPVLARRDETIASVYLLSLSELIIPDFVPGSWQTHAQGMLHLLRLRGPQQLSTSHGQQLFRLVHTPILLAALRSGTEPPPESDQLVQWIQASNRPQSTTVPSLGARYMFKVIALRARLKELLERMDSSYVMSTHRELITNMLLKGQMLDLSNDIASWSEDCPIWKAYPTSCNVGYWQATESVDLTKHSSHQLYFRSLWAMAHWVRPWTTCLYLNESLVEAIDHLNDSTHGGLFSHEMLDGITRMLNWKDLFQGRIILAADKILGCIGYAFGDITSDDGVSHSLNRSPSCTASAIGPMYMLYALEAVAGCASTTESQKQLARGALRRTAEERGIRTAYPSMCNDA